MAINFDLGLSVNDFTNVLRYLQGRGYDINNMFGNSNGNNSNFTGGLQGFWKNYGDMINTGLGAGWGLYNIFRGNRQDDMMKRMLEHQIDLTNRNLYNQSMIVNNKYDSDANIAASMVGNLGNDGSVGLTSQNVYNAYQNEANKKHVNGNPIG